MSDQLYLSTEITLKKDFLLYIHAHELFAEIKGIRIDHPSYIAMWESTPDISTHWFGGAYGSQFTTIEQYLSFDSAFNNILAKHGIHTDYKNPLLYIISFLSADYQAQSLERNRVNRLREYARFILDLHANCSAHFEAMVKNKDYQMIYDEAANEYFFARKSLLKAYSLKEVIKYRQEDVPGDLIQYLRINVYETELYVPHNLLLGIVSDNKLKTFEGEQVDHLLLPASLQSEVFKFTIDYMLTEHKKYDTSFYKALNQPDLTRRDFTKYYNQYKKHNISYTQSMLRVGQVISDYLIANKQSKNKSTVAAFLFEYFSLFKAIPLKNQIEFPTDYIELPNFYNRNGITKDSIRYMMKDAVVVGGI